MWIELSNSMIDMKEEESIICAYIRFGWVRLLFTVRCNYEPFLDINFTLSTSKPSHMVFI